MASRINKSKNGSKSKTTNIVMDTKDPVPCYQKTESPDIVQQVLNEVFAEAGMGDYTPIFVGNDCAVTKPGADHTLQVELSKSRKFTLYHVKDGNTIRFEQYRDRLADSVPNTLELTVQRWMKLTLAEESLTKTLRSVINGDIVDRSEHLGECVVKYLILDMLASVVLTLSPQIH
jgi:hypothetical protein